MLGSAGITSERLATLVRGAVGRRLPKLPGQPVARLFDGHGDGLASLLLDRYGALLVAHWFPQGKCSRPEGLLLREALGGLETFLHEASGTRTLVFKTHHADPRRQRECRPATLWGPEPVDGELLEENGLRFELRPNASLFCGLYPDTAFLRARLRGLTVAKVINAFCFTGALGIACAKEGREQEILQLDSSPAVLAWAEANWVLNRGAYPQTSMRFLCDDVLNFLHREAVRIGHGAAKSGLILLDPPSFGRGRKKLFSLKNDAPALLDAALACLAPGGTLVFTANCRSWAPDKLAQLAHDAAKRAGRGVRSSEVLWPPAEFFPSREPHSSSVRGVWMEVG